MDNRKTKWLSFEKQIKPEGRKTDIFHVYTEERFLLAKIYWYGSWRQYVIEPSPNTVYEINCLTDITTFLTDLKRERTKVSYTGKPGR